MVDCVSREKLQCNRSTANILIIIIAGAVYYFLVGGGAWLVLCVQEAKRANHW